MIHLDYRDARPIYSQIADNFRSQVAAGILVAGDKLPSVRELASQLAINPNTIQRAYRELEAGGYCYSVPGKGSFVGAGADVNRQRREELLRTVRESVKELEYLGVKWEEVCAYLSEGGENT